MAVNHNININLHGSGGTSSKTSAKRSITNMKQKNTTSLKLGKVIAKSPQMFNANTFGISGLKRLGIAGAIAYSTVTIANRVTDIFLDIHQASTGDQLAVGNFRRVRSYVLNPVSYFVDDIYKYGILQQKNINRQNYANEYYRDLTGKAIVGNQYGQKR